MNEKLKIAAASIYLPLGPEIRNMILSSKFDTQISMGATEGVFTFGFLGAISFSIGISLGGGL